MSFVKRTDYFACSAPIAGNHNDFYQVDYHVTTMIQSLSKEGVIIAKGTVVNADKEFCCIKLRKKIFRLNLIPNIKENNKTVAHINAEQNAFLMMNNTSYVMSMNDCLHG